MLLLQRFNDLRRFGTCGKIGLTNEFWARLSESRLVRPERPVLPGSRFCATLRTLRLVNPATGARLLMGLLSKVSIVSRLNVCRKSTLVIELSLSVRFSRLINADRLEKSGTPGLPARLSTRRFDKASRGATFVIGLP